MLNIQEWVQNTFEKCSINFPFRDKKMKRCKIKVWTNARFNPPLPLYIRQHTATMEDDKHNGGII